MSGPISVGLRDASDGDAPIVVTIDHVSCTHLADVDLTLSAALRLSDQLRVAVARAVTSSAVASTFDKIKDNEA